MSSTCRAIVLAGRLIRYFYILTIQNLEAQPILSFTTGLRITEASLFSFIFRSKIFRSSADISVTAPFHELFHHVSFPCKVAVVKAYFIMISQTVSFDIETPRFMHIRILLFPQRIMLVRNFFFLFLFLKFKLSW